MRTSLALFSVTLAMGTAVEASPLNFAALLGRNNDKAADDKSAGRHDECVQVKSKDGLCVSPANERAAEGGQVTLVDCGKASSWRVADGYISLCDESELALSAGKDVRDGSRLELAREGSEFRVNDDGTISVGDQCLDTGRDNSLQTWTCYPANENQQFKAHPVQERENKGQEDNKGKEEDKKEDDKKDDVRTENTRPAATATATVTEWKTQTDHAIETKVQNNTQYVTKTAHALETKTQENEKIVTQTQTYLQDVIKPTTKTETKVETQAPVTVTETPKPVTKYETKYETKTQEPVTKYETKTQEPVTKYETKYETKTKEPVTKYETKYETKYATKTVEKEAQPTKDAGREEHGKEEYRDDGKDQQGKDEHRDYSQEQGKEEERH